MGARWNQFTHLLSLPAGATVECRYREGHTGIALAVDDPRAWAGSIAFPDTVPPSLPDADAVKRHVKWCWDRGLLRDSRPVLWQWGVMWDHDLTIVRLETRERPHVECDHCEDPREYDADHGAFY